MVIILHPNPLSFSAEDGMACWRPNGRFQNPGRGSGCRRFVIPQPSEPGRRRRDPFGDRDIFETTAEGSGCLRQLKRNLKHARPDVFQNCLSGSGVSAQKIAAFRYHRFAGDQRRSRFLHSIRASMVGSLATIQERHNHARIQQGSLQRPKPFRCFLLEPRSEIPEENLPSPAISRFGVAMPQKAE